MKRVIGYIIVLSLIMGQIGWGNVIYTDAKADASITVQQGKNKTLSLLGKMKVKKTKWTVKNKKIVKLLKKGKKKVTIRGLKVGKTSVTAKIYGKKGKFKRVTIVVKVTAKRKSQKKPAKTVKPTVSTSTPTRPPVEATPVHNQPEETPVSKATATPNYEPEDIREKRVVEDFESYDVGYDWESDEYKGTSGKATKGKEYVNSDCGKMTVVQDPEDPTNKCLKIEYTGDTQAYDYAPIFDIKLLKTLDDYSGIMFQSRVVARNTGNCKNKKVYAYFGKYDSITPEHYFATTKTKADAEKQGIAEDLVKYSIDSPHATGADESYTVLNRGDEFEGMVYNNCYFPTMFDDWNKEKKNENRTIGFKESENDTYKAGWHTNRLNLNKGNITEDKVLTSKNISLVIGSNYAGRYPSANASLTLYIDNITFLESFIPCTEFGVENVPSKMTKGMKMKITADDFIYTPDNTTQTQLSWTSSDEHILNIDTSRNEPIFEAISAGKVTVTVAVMDNPSVRTSFEIEICEPSANVSDLTFDLSKLKIMPKKTADDTTTKVYSTMNGATQSGGVLGLEFTKADKGTYVLDLGRAYDLSGYRGFSLVGKATEQMTIEMYPDTANFQEDKYWTKQVELATYPFFEGSHALRSYEGTSYGEVGVEEEFWINWCDGTDSKGTLVEGTVPGGNLTNVRYVMLKTNKFDSNKPEHIYQLKTLTFKKDWRENTKPTDEEINENPELYPEYR